MSFPVNGVLKSSCWTFLRVSSKIYIYSPTLCHCRQINTIKRFSNYNQSRNYHKTAFLGLQTTANAAEKKDMMTSEFEIAPKVAIFQEHEKRDKQTFLKIIKLFNGPERMRRGHVEFVFAAMKCMEEFNAQYDIEVYKKLMDVFPKGKYIAKNMIQAEFFHFPRHQECGVLLLDLMERNGVMPDKELKEIVLNVFGQSSLPFKKYCRMLYWMPKFKNINPYQLPDPLPSDIEQLARLALNKMSVDPRTTFTHFKADDLEGSLDKTWIVSAQSPVQKKMLKSHPPDKPLYVEGTYLVWMKRLTVSYFVLRADSITRPQLDLDGDDVSNLSMYMFGEPKPLELVIAPSSVHEQEDATIFGMCATGTSSKDSVLSWIRFLRQSIPELDKMTILFTLKSGPTSLTNVNAPHHQAYDTVQEGEDLAKEV